MLQPTLALSGTHRRNMRNARLLASARRLPPPLAHGVERAIGARQVGQRLGRFGLQPVTVVTAPVDRLLVQRPVRCELVPSREATTLDFLDGYMTDESGAPDWRIGRSMQARLLSAHAAGRLPADLSQTDYSRWHARLHEAGINERPPEMIARKLEGLIALYESIRRDGYRFAGIDSYIWVLEEPLSVTRYGYSRLAEGLEIFDGHHRAAALACLGYEAIPVLLLRDVGTHTAFGVPLEEIGRGCAEP
jgi:hypothetical protein